MQIRKQRTIRLALAIMVSLSASMVTGSATAQNVIRDYLVPEQRHYSPDDYDERGWVYRVQAGYAGLFNRCDDDALKRYSPYIYWKARPLPACRGRIYPNVSDAAIEIQEGVQRFTDGAGNCAVPNNCQDGPPRFLPTLANGMMGARCQAPYPSPALGTPVFHGVPADTPSPEAVSPEQESLPGGGEWDETQPQSDVESPSAYSPSANQVPQARSRKRPPIAGAPIGRSSVDMNEPRRLAFGDSSAAKSTQAITSRARQAGIHSVDHLSATAGQSATQVSRTASRTSSSRRR